MHGIEFCPAHEADPDDIMELLCSSYGPTLAQDHSAELAQKALPVLCQPVPNLLKAAHYVLARREGRVVAVGGWSRETPFGRPGVEGLGHVRHLAVHPGALRAGLGRAIFGWIAETAEAAQVTRLACLSTQGAAPFFKAMGMRAQGDVLLELAPGVSLPAVQMCRAG